MARFCSPAHAGSFVLTLLMGVSLGIAQAQNEPILVPDAVDYQKLLPILPQPPQGWTADKAEGSTEDVGGFRITNVHRDYHKGEGENAPTAAISILDSVASAPRPLHGIATAKLTRATANLSPSMATRASKLSRKKANMQLYG